MIGISWTKEAKEGYQKLLNYLIQNNSQQELLAVDEGIEKTLHLVKENPLMYPIYKDSIDVRKAVITKRCVVFYRFKNNRIEVLGVFDTRQDPSKINL